MQVSTIYLMHLADDGKAFLAELYGNLHQVPVKVGTPQCQLSDA